MIGLDLVNVHFSIAIPFLKGRTMLTTPDKLKESKSGEKAAWWLWLPAVVPTTVLVCAVLGIVLPSMRFKFEADQLLKDSQAMLSKMKAALEELNTNLRDDANDEVQQNIGALIRKSAKLVHPNQVGRLLVDTRNARDRLASDRAKIGEESFAAYDGFFSGFSAYANTISKSRSEISNESVSLAQIEISKAISIYQNSNDHRSDKPTIAFLHFALGNLDMKFGSDVALKQAESELLTAVENSPAEPRYQLNLAICKTKRSNLLPTRERIRMLEDSLNYFEKSISVPTSTKVSQIYNKNNYSEAEMALAELLESNSERQEGLLARCIARLTPLVDSGVSAVDVTMCEALCLQMSWHAERRTKEAEEEVLKKIGKAVRDGFRFNCESRQDLLRSFPRIANVPCKDWPQRVLRVIQKNESQEHVVAI